ncbi:MAG: type II toxin-antitoxin system RelE/ParE family toxin [Polyangia bacterium]
MKVIFAPEAEQDLSAALEFLGARAPAAAVRMYTNVSDIVFRLAEGDFEGPEHRLRRGAIVRSWPVPPYRIYYQRDEDALRIVRIYHQARRPITR